jgi:hypothetical protein
LVSNSITELKYLIAEIFIQNDEIGMGREKIGGLFERLPKIEEFIQEGASPSGF